MTAVRLSVPVYIVATKVDWAWAVGKPGCHHGLSCPCTWLPQGEKERLLEERRMAKEARRGGRFPHVASAMRCVRNELAP